MQTKKNPDNCGFVKKKKKQIIRQESLKEKVECIILLV